MDGVVDPNFDMQGFAQRAREAMFPEKITAFAQRVGLPQATVSKIMSGGSVAGPRLDIAAKIAEGLGVSLDWLAFGRGDGPSTESVLRVPRYDVHLAAGAGAWNEGRVEVEHIPVTLSFLQQQFGRTTATGLAVLTARGDSMEPTIKDKGLVVIDQGVTELFDDVFAFVLAGEARVKRFRRLTDGLMLISDNEDYPPETVKGSDMERLQIIGQVLGVLQAI
ncbi:MAG: helix-turn-helix transcriptional regulator [Phenylobacterium sp.]|uniref:LexA family transcriptional regulator n=1 Tax=Phenylobacterium sp. TaxID=1871053 RepID=UPI003919FC7A